MTSMGGIRKIGSKRFGCQPTTEKSQVDALAEKGFERMKSAGFDPVGTKNSRYLEVTNLRH